jgi:putative DNA primase/helicase
MADKFTGKFTWCGDENTWYHWDDKLWRKDKTQAIMRAAEQMTEDILSEAAKLMEEDEKKGAALYKHGLISQSKAKVHAAVDMFAIRPGITRPSSDFDAKNELITVPNGTLNLKTKELKGFDPSLLHRRMLNAEYNPDATAPQFEAFLAKVLPDPAMRAYIQRGMGYTLLGEVNQKAMFILHGPSHTGKSQFLLLMEKLFGDFGSTAAASAFKETKGEASNNLHDLKGKRFVTTSETSEQAKLNEELIKRLTGKDNVVSRQLYEKNLTWTPEMTIWMATNFLPKVNGDDDAMWRRVKPIHFNVVFSDAPGAANVEVVDIAEKIFAVEASGMLNWVLAGVQAVLESGLDEPVEVKAAVEAYKLESNNVAEFLEDALNSDIVTRNPEPTAAIEMGHLFRMYEEWCKRSRVDHPYGQKRFGNRIRALGYEVRKISNMRCIGLAAGIHSSLLGTM